VDYNYNSIVLNDLSAFVSNQEYHLILNCELTKEAWDILQVTHEGTSSMK